MLCQEQIDQYHQEGFLVLDQIISTETLMEIKARRLRLLNNGNPILSQQPYINDNNRSGDHYFLQSAERYCFLRRKLSINRVI